MCGFFSPFLWNEQAAHAKLEEIVWPNGPVCPHCGTDDRIGAVTGRGARIGLKFCCCCRRQFRATMGTLFEGSHVPLHKWFQVCFLLIAADTRINAHRLHLRLGVTNKTALTMLRRLDRALADAGRGDRPARTGAGLWTETFGRPPAPPQPTLPARPPASAGNPAAPAALICAELPWTELPWTELPWTELPWTELPWTELPWDELPWTARCGAAGAGVRFTPTRQFLGFLETTPALGRAEREGRLDELLAKVGRWRARRPARRERCGADLRSPEIDREGPMRAGRREKTAHLQSALIEYV